VVVGGVVEVAPAPWPDAPVVPGLPEPVRASPVEPDLPSMVPLVAEPPVAAPAAELPLVSLPPIPMLLHAVRASAVMLPMRIP